MLAKTKKEGGASDTLNLAVSDYSQTRCFLEAKNIIYQITIQASATQHVLPPGDQLIKIVMLIFFHEWNCAQVHHKNAVVPETCETEFTATHATKTEKSSVRNSLKCVFWKPICPQQSPFQISGNYRANITS